MDKGAGASRTRAAAGAPGAAREYTTAHGSADPNRRRWRAARPALRIHWPPPNGRASCGQHSEPAHLNADHHGGPIVDWLNRQPPARKRLYTVLLVIPFLTIPCYITGLALLAAGAPREPGPQLATATATSTPAPFRRVPEGPPTFTIEAATDEPTSEPAEVTPTGVVIVVTATGVWTDTPTAPPATSTPVAIATETPTQAAPTATVEATPTPPPTALVPIETETPPTPPAVLR